MRKKIKLTLQNLELKHMMEQSAMSGNTPLGLPV